MNIKGYSGLESVSVSNRRQKGGKGQAPADIVRKRNTDSAIRAESYRKLENLKQQCNVCKSTFIEYYDWQSGAARSTVLA